MAVSSAPFITYLAICQGEKLHVACMIDSTGPFTGLHFIFFKGVSLRESLYASCVSHESSLEPDLSWNAKSLIQADVLLWPKNLGERHCDNKVASYLTAFLLK